MIQPHRGNRTEQPPNRSCKTARRKKKKRSREVGTVASQRAYPKLTLNDRRVIELGLDKGESVREMARRLQPRHATQEGASKSAPLVAIADDRDNPSCEATRATASTNMPIAAPADDTNEAIDMLTAKAQGTPICPLARGES